MRMQMFGWVAAVVVPAMVAMAQQTVPAVDVTEQSPGQNPAASESQEPALKLRPPPKPNEGRIHLDVVVIDRKGGPVLGLEQKDFTILDNKQPAKIISFHARDASAQQTSPPAEVILLLDAVNLDYLTVSRTRDEMARFLRQNGGQLPCPFTILVFSDDGARVLVQRSTDGNSMAAQLDKSDASLRVIDRSGGENGASERFNLSVKWLRMVAESEGRQPRRKLLIWAGPGWPLLDQADITTSPRGHRLLFDWAVDFSTTLREAHVALYSISLSNPAANSNVFDPDLYEGFLKGVKTANQMDSANLALKVLAVQSGGRVISPDNDLASQIRTCVQDASAFYSLSFDPPHTNGMDEYHDLKVVVNRPKVNARTNTGYYNQP